MKLDDHTALVVEDVSFACGSDERRPELGYVWIDSGWAIATDAYRLEMREVDVEGSWMINPYSGAVVRARTSDQVRHVDRLWALFGRYPRATRYVELDRSMLADLPKRATSRNWFGYDFATRKVIDFKNGGRSNPANEPLVNAVYLAELLLAADADRIHLRWTDDRKPMVLAEDEHRSMLMPIYRGSSW